MPSFPAPGLGALVAVAPARWLELRAAALEAAPEIGSIGLDTAFRGDGAFLAATIVVRHDIDAFSGGYTLGGWQRTGPESARGLLAVVDTHILVAPDIDRRSVQLFVRFGWSPDKPGGVGLHTGGGVTLHGLLGRSNDTLGLGGGVADVPDGIEAFLELFYKLRLAPWLTFEPEAQLFLHPGGAGDPALIIGLRGKIKL